MFRPFTIDIIVDIVRFRSVILCSILPSVYFLLVSPLSCPLLDYLNIFSILFLLIYWLFW